MIIFQGSPIDLGMFSDFISTKTLGNLWWFPEELSIINCQSLINTRSSIIKVKSDNKIIFSFEYK